MQALMDAATRKLVRERARNICEYCHLPQEATPFTVFHVEHITARQHHGTDDPSNLALACHHCNSHKGPNLTGVDPETARIVLLFHPRRDLWNEHFRRIGALILGFSPTGRATVDVLAMNEPEWVELRAEFDAG
jgi:hypothetical protein